MPKWIVSYGDIDKGTYDPEIELGLGAMDEGEQKSSYD